MMVIVSGEQLASLAAVAARKARTKTIIAIAAANSDTAARRSAAVWRQRSAGGKAQQCRRLP